MASPTKTQPLAFDPFHELAFGIDIGGTLVKLVFFEPDLVAESEVDKLDRVYKVMDDPASYGSTGELCRELNIKSDRLGGTLHFARFATSGVSTFIEITSQHKDLAWSPTVAGATGGGAFKYSQEFASSLGFEFPCLDELDCLVAGISTLCALDSEECYYLDLNPTSNSNWGGRGYNEVLGEQAVLRKVPVSLFTPDGTSPYPFLVVNIGTGVSILRVDGEASYTRVGGTSLGGGTFLGLCRLLTGITTFDEALALAAQGDSSHVDVLVGDIYGRDYSGVGLTASTTASSFGKMMSEAGIEKATKADLAASLLMTITNNIGQLAKFAARQEKASTVIFAGSFLNNNTMAKRALSFGLHYWTGGTVNAMFLKHQGYHGAVGALFHFRCELKRKTRTETPPAASGVAATTTLNSSSSSTPAAATVSSPPS